MFQGLILYLFVFMFSITPFYHCLFSTADEIENVRQEASNSAKTMALNVVRLCFQAFLLDEAGRMIHIPPVISEPIFDSSTLHAV